MSKGDGTTAENPSSFGDAIQGTASAFSRSICQVLRSEDFGGRPELELRVEEKTGAPGCGAASGDGAGYGRGRELLRSQVSA